MPDSAEDLDLEALKLAFLRHMLGRIAEVDQVVVDQEKALIDAICPPDALRRVGLIDDQGRTTPLADPATVRALMVLPVQLSKEDRLGLVSQLARVAVADGRVDLGEKSFVAVGGQLLGLSMQILADHLKGSGVQLALPPTTG